jgi:hypothetical protein
MIRSSSRLRIFIVLPALAIILAAFSAWCSGCAMLAIPARACKGCNYNPDVSIPGSTAAASLTGENLNKPDAYF